jgi:hypothetical protein
LPAAILLICRRRSPVVSSSAAQVLLPVVSRVAPFCAIMWSPLVTASPHHGGPMVHSASTAASLGHRRLMPVETALLHVAPTLVVRWRCGAESLLHVCWELVRGLGSAVQAANCARRLTPGQLPLSLTHAPGSSALVANLSVALFLSTSACVLGTPWARGSCLVSNC